MRRITFWGILAGLTVLGSAIGWSQVDRLREIAQAREAGGSLETEVNSSAPTRVGALGRIEPGSEVLDIGGPAGDRVDKLLVSEGQKVAAGDELAYLESHDIALAEQQEIAALLEEAKSRAATTREHGEASIRAAELHLETVLELEPLRIESQRARLRSTDVEARNAEDEFLRAERLLSGKTMSREDYNRRQVEHLRQQELLTSAKLALAELEANFKLSKATAEAELARAKAALTQSLATIPIQSLEQRLALAKVRVRQSILRAPIAGQVLKIHTWPGERIGNDPILKLGNTDEVHAVAEVYETDIARVRVGQKARVTCPALERPIEGEVVQVGLMIYKNDVLSVDPAADADARVVEVRVRLNEPKLAARLTYLQVDVLIDVGTPGNNP